MTTKATSADSESSTHGFTIRFPKRNTAAVAAAALLLGSGGTFGGLNLFGAKAEAPPAPTQTEISMLRTELAQVREEVRAVANTVRELDEDSEELQRVSKIHTRNQLIICGLMTKPNQRNPCREP